jgi:hypothetical protein
LGAGHWLVAAYPLIWVFLGVGSRVFGLLVMENSSLVP